MTHSFVNKAGRDYVIRLCLALVLLGLSVAMAQAASTSEGALPWDTPIDRVAQGISGPVAFLFALGALIVCGVRWIFGGEMGAMTRALLTTVIGLCLLVMAARFLEVLFGITGALVAG